jgi:hypothetical protein
MLKVKSDYDRGFRKSHLIILLIIYIHMYALFEGSVARTLFLQFLNIISYRLPLGKNSKEKCFYVKSYHLLNWGDSIS